MGKIRRERKTYHLQAAKVDEGQESTSGNDSKKLQYGRLEPLPKTFKPLGNPDAAMFKGLKIDAKDLVQRLPELDSKLVISLPLQRKPIQLLPKMYKKEKMKLRRTTFLNKIEAIMNAEKEAKAAKKRQKTAVVGDVRPLADALPKIDMPNPSIKKARVTKVRPMKKFKARQMQMMKDIKAFKDVCNHPSFKRDPQDTILDHLKNKLKEELK